VSTADRTSMAVFPPEPLDIELHEPLVRLPSAGAHVVFCGVVRDSDHGREVVQPRVRGTPRRAGRAERGGGRVRRDPDVVALAVSHRGVLAAATSRSLPRWRLGTAARRSTSAVGWWRGQHRLPIWKRQVSPDGTDEWVNCP